MFGFKKIVRRIQKKPYETKVKILWIGVGAAFIFIVALWILTINIRSRGDNQDYPIFSELQNNINKLKHSNPFSK